MKSTFVKLLHPFLGRDLEIATIHRALGHVLFVQPCLIDSSASLNRMRTIHRHIPPIGIHFSQDITNRNGRFRARVRWTDPRTHERLSYSATFNERTKAEEFLEQLQSRTRVAGDPLVSLADYIDEVGERYLRGVDPTSTANGYRGSIRLRVVPALGHLPVRTISTALIDRAIDVWERNYSTSTVKHTVSALTRVLDEAVRDEIIVMNSARTRARRRISRTQIPREDGTPTLEAVEEIASVCRRVHPVYGDFVLISALLAARISEVSGLQVGDVDWERQLVTISRQHFPGAGGLCVKSTKSRRPRRVPILAHLAPVLRRITTNRAPDEPLLRGPRGGVLTTGTISRATDWNNTVSDLGHPGLRRHDLRHAGATWFANAGVPLHTVSRILGHGSLETTRGYLHPDASELLLVAKQVDRHLAWR